MRPVSVALRRLSVVRRHGLGNVLLLLPVLRTLLHRGCAVELVTRPEWGQAVAALLPGLAVAAERRPETVDLDEATRELPPAEHRTDELARILGVAPPLDEERPEVPEAWKEPFRRLAGGIVFAPEASHPARRWPEASVRAVAEALRGSGLCLTGLESRPDLPCDHDFRGRLTLKELFGLVAVSRCVITMDSATLHVARLAGTPCVAIFGGIDPAYRLRAGDRVVALSAGLDCCPCNKRETCEGRYDCLSAVPPRAVLSAVQAAGSLRELVRVRV